MPSLVSNWDLDGFVSEQRYYCSETPIDPLNLPVPKAVLAGDVRTYIDIVGVEKGKQYYLAVGSVKNGIEKLSDQVIKLAGVAWTPADLSNPSKLWVSSDSVIADSSNRISQLTDKSGNNHHFTQSNNSYKPVLAIVDGNPVIRFDGSNDVLYGVESTKSIFRNIDKYFIFFVYKSSIGGQAEQFLIHSSQASSTAWRAGIRVRETGNTDVLGRVNDSTYFANGFTNNHDIQIGAMYVNMQTGAISVADDGKSFNSITVTAGSIPNTASANVMSIGGNESNSATYALKGDIYEIIVSTNALSNTDKQKLEGWAAHKYGLTANLPSDHPYKTLVPVL